VRDAVSYVAERPGIDARRVRAVIEVSDGLPPGWEERVTKGMGPVLVVHGAADPVVPVSEAYKVERVMKERGVACEVEVFPGRDIGFLPRRRGRC
jgi:carboxymethylenebutenolidase